MNERVKLIQPYITFDELSTELKEILNSGQLTKGTNVAQFISTLKSYCNSEYAFLTTSATTALSVCLKALGIEAGDKVAVSDFSFPATANVVEDLGAIPVFIDVDINTFNMSVDDLESKFSENFKAVIFVDALGNPSGLLQIKSLCEKYNIPLIEDAACAIGSSINGRKVGSIADLTCFSFHPRKLLTTGEGGAILTNSLKYADWLEVKLNHGAWGFKGKSMDFIDYGYNFRMSEIQALLGWKQVDKLDVIVKDRNIIATVYKEALNSLGFVAQKVDDDVVHNVQSVVFKTPSHISRNDLIDFLSKNNIESTLGTYCLSGGSYYKNKYNNIQPISCFLEDHTITLPCYADINVHVVVDAIQSYLK